MTVGDGIPAVSEYGFLTILVLVFLAILAAIVILAIASRNPRPGEVVIRIFLGLVIRVRWGQLDDQTDTTAELPRVNDKSALERVLRRLRKRKDPK
jgi:hypothetical protein